VLLDFLPQRFRTTSSFGLAFFWKYFKTKELKSTICPDKNSRLSEQTAVNPVLLWRPYIAISFHGARVTWHCFTSNGENMPNVGYHIPLTILSALICKNTSIGKRNRFCRGQ